MGTTNDGPRGNAAGGAQCPESACVTGDWELSLVLSEQWSVPLSARFTYRADDPYAVRLDFYLCTQHPVSWVFARELLTTGLVRPAGDADVRVGPAQDSALVSLSLNSLQGDALFGISAEPLTEWLERTYQLVPPGQEHRFLDLDGLVEHLLQETPDGCESESGSGDRAEGPYEHPDGPAGHQTDNDDGQGDAHGDLRSN